TSFRCSSASPPWFCPFWLCPFWFCLFWLCPYISPKHSVLSSRFPAHRLTAMDESAKLNRIARELDERDESQEAGSSATERLDRWLTTLVNRGASDLLLVQDAPACMRMDGEVRKIEPGVLDGADIEAAVLPALTRHALQLYRERLISD